MKLGYNEAQLRSINQRAAEFMLGLRAAAADSTVVVSGCVGRRGDAYADLGPRKCRRSIGSDARHIAASATAYRYG